MKNLLCLIALSLALSAQLFAQEEVYDQAIINQEQRMVFLQWNFPHFGGALRRSQRANHHFTDAEFNDGRNPGQFHHCCNSVQQLDYGDSDRQRDPCLQHREHARRPLHAE